MSKGKGERALLRLGCTSGSTTCNTHRSYRFIQIYSLQSIFLAQSMASAFRCLLVSAVSVPLLLFCSNSIHAFQTLNFERGSDDNPLWEYFLQHNQGPVVHKWHSYFDVYHRYFQRFRDVPVNFLEIGVQSGGSLGMWSSYFRHPNSRVYGIDINPYCKLFEEYYPGVSIFIGSQSNRTFLRDVVSRTPKMDIILDDAGHTMVQQIVGMEELYHHVKDGGLYMVEDVATSYWPRFGGTLNPVNHTETFMSYAKRLLDRLHHGYLNAIGHTYTLEERTRLDRHGPVNFTEVTLSVGFYDQIVVFERGSRPPMATRSYRGDFKIPYTEEVAFDPAVMQQYREQLLGNRG